MFFGSVPQGPPEPQSGNMLNKIKMYIPGLKYRPSMGQGICWFSCLGIFKHLLKFKYHYRRLFVTSLDFSF